MLFMGTDRTPSDRFLPARYYALLLELAQSKDPGIGETLSTFDLDPSTLNLPDTLLSLDQVDALIEAATRATGSDELGFHLGRLIKPSSHEFLGYALMTSATLDEALRMASRYWRLITPTFTLRHVQVAGGTRINLEPAFELKPLTLTFHVEAIATAFHAEICFLLSNRASAYDLHLPAWLAPAARRYRQLAPVRTHFDGHQGSGLQIRLPAEMLAQPLVLADRNALAIARNRCEQELSRLTRHGSLTDWLRLMLDEASDHQPRQRELADILHLSTRTLNRRLASEGTGFRELGIQSRHRRACQLLLDTDMPITRIALQLGYKDAANFTRAFGREQGISPTEFRNMRNP
jgi:AraC-like DNA-binding protein